MFLIVVYQNQERVLTVPDDATLEILKGFIGAEFDVPQAEVTLEFASSTLQSGLTLQQQAVVDGSLITCRRRRFQISDINPNSTPAQLLDICEQFPHVLTQILSQDPEMGNLLQNKDEGGLRMLQMKRVMKGYKSIFERSQEEKRLWADPDNPENQRRIQELIQREQIDAAHAFAMENNPEAFASVSMLYVNLTINGHPLKAFVDSGAQMTIMSAACAERCGLLRLMDSRYAGVASGVGTGKILGKIHMVQMKLGNSFFPISVTVLEDDKMECLFGLDTLKRYRCCINLHKNVLQMLDGSAGPEEVPFLGESEIPKSVFKTNDDETMMADSSASVTHEAIINQLMQLTARSREDVIAALEQSSGNAELAATLLLAST